MSQYRLNTYGALIETSDQPEMAANLMSPGRLVGNDFQVAASDLLQVSSGSCLLPDGVTVIETEIKTIVVNLSSQAADYTVLYQLEDTTTLGGSPAILTLLGGIKRQKDLTDSTILGWIRYPGANVPLDTSFFIQPSHLRVTTDPAEFYYQSLCPLSEAIKPGSGSLSTSKTTLADMTVTSSTPIFFGTESRVSEVSIMPGALIAEHATNYLDIEIKKGTEVLFHHSTRNVTLGGQGDLAQPAAMVKDTPTPDKFIVGASEFITLEVTRYGTVPATSGEFVLTIESPASSGTWTETVEYLDSEPCVRFKNISAVYPAEHTLRFPFSIPDRQPSKLVSRLLVDNNCQVAFSINLKGTTLALTPNSGFVSNTESLITQEFYVPYDDSITWEPGETAYIEVTTNAFAGTGVSLAYVALTLEPTPFTLFV